jgi:hypothetical protein
MRGAAGRRPPHRDGLFGKPQRQITPFSQSSFILAPVPHAIPLLGVLLLCALWAPLSHIMLNVLENGTIS